MRLTSTSIENDRPIPERCAFGVTDAAEHMRLGENLSPQLSWSGVPENAKSLVLLCVDPDVPSIGDDVNKEGATIPRDLERVNFGHWGLVDLPAADGGLTEGECSRGVTVGGKDDPPGPAGTRQALNDYTSFMAGSEMAGDYFGYDGPCPPWNDEILHHYHLTLYALDVERAPIEGSFDGAALLSAIEGHVLESASIVGSYAINPDARLRG